MRISVIDLQCEDIMWFGIDKNGYIFECTSAGCGNVPEFVCKSFEEMNELVEYFIDKLEISTKEKIVTKYDEENQLVKDCIELARKGVYCYDFCEEKDHINEYKKVTEPLKPIHYNDLPQNIKDIMKDHRVDIDVNDYEYITVKHAY